MTTELRDAEKTAAAEGIAAALGEVAKSAAWTMHQPNEWSRHVLHPDGYGCHLSFRDGRINVSGVWPKSPVDGREVSPHGRYGETSPDISLSQERSVIAIAKDIVRRFLPPYLEVYQRMVTRLQDEDAYASKTAATVRALRVANGQPAVQPNTNGRSADVVFLRANHAHSVSANGAGVRFEYFTCPLNVAVQIIALLAKPETDDDA